MDPVIFVEVLGRRGQVDQRVRVERFPFLLGRAYTCDLILDDRHVCPEHARLELDGDGQISLRDLGSRNGVLDLSTGLRVGSLTPAQGRELRIGRTVLRLRAPDHAVAPALVDAGPHRLLRWATSSAAPVVWLPVVVAVQAWLIWRENYSELETRSVLGALLPLVLAVVAWAGMWALLGRLLVHLHRFAAHLAAACASLLIWTGFSGLLDYARFALSPIGPLQNASIAAGALLIAALVYIHLFLATGLGRHARALASAGVLAIALVVAALDDREDPDFWVHTLPYWSQLEPVDPGWLPAESPEEFFGGARGLEGELAALAERERRKGR
jgi:hypothetical protein